MEKYKILFVDEVESDINRFKRYVKKNDTDKNFELVVMTPENTLEKFLNQIEGGVFDAIITDYRLYEENKSIEFDGLSLVKAILNKKINFPCFVLTSFDDDAVIEGDDVNIIYTKDIMNRESQDKVSFLDKIKNQILHYKKRILDSENELLELVKKSNLNAKDEARLLELDTFIEQSTDKKSALPEPLKGTKNLNTLHKMIKNTDKILEILNQNNSNLLPKP
jgi:acylphosphatase/dsDNA-binding SOS-regulon protein